MAGEHDRLVKVDREREPIPANSLALDAQIHAAAAHHQRLRRKRRIKYVVLITVITLVIVTIITGMALLISNRPVQSSPKQVSKAKFAQLAAQMQKPPPTRIDSSDEEDAGYALLAAKKIRPATKTEPETIIIPSRKQFKAFILNGNEINL